LRQGTSFRPVGGRLAKRCVYETAGMGRLDAAHERGGEGGGGQSMGVGSPAPVRGAEVGEPQLAAMAGRSAFNLVVDRQAGGALSAERLLSTLRQLVTSSLVMIDGHLYRQRNGIPQGSIASALLCCLHYGSLDLTLLTTYLSHRAMPPPPCQPPARAQGLSRESSLGTSSTNLPLEPVDPSRAARGQAPSSPTFPTGAARDPDSSSRPGATPSKCSVLLRLIDDSLCVSSDVRVRDGFLTTMAHGFVSYGCSTSVAKTRAASGAGRASLGRAIHATGTHAEIGAACCGGSVGSNLQCVASCDLPGPAFSRPTSGASTGFASEDIPFRDITAGSMAVSGLDDAQDPRAAAIGPTACDARGREYFGWCGLLFNMVSCEVHPDMGRRRASLRVPGRAPLSSLRDRMRTAAKPQLRALFVDPTLNSTLTVRRNLNHAFLHAISSALAATGRAAASRHPEVVTSAVAELACFAARVVRNNQRRCLSTAIITPHSCAASTNGAIIASRGAGDLDSAGEASASETRMAANHDGAREDQQGLPHTDGGREWRPAEARGSGPHESGLLICSTLVDKLEVEWLAWQALLQSLPAGIPKSRAIARRRRSAIESSGRLCARSLELLREASDPRGLIQHTLAPL